jgi:hypothetical protein
MGDESGDCGEISRGRVENGEGNQPGRGQAAGKGEKVQEDPLREGCLLSASWDGGRAEARGRGWWVGTRALYMTVRLQFVRVSRLVRA